MLAEGTYNLSVNLTTNELREFRKCSDAERCSLSEWVRKACMVRLAEYNLRSYDDLMLERELRKGKKSESSLRQWGYETRETQKKT